MKICKGIAALLCLWATFAPAQPLKTVSAPDAPQAIGPYSQAIRAQGLVFTAGQLPLDPATGQLVGNNAAAQAERALKNLEAVLKASGSNLGLVVKTTLYLKNLSDFAAVNEVYARFFKEHPPARSTVQVAALAKDALIEIDAIALDGAGH